MTEVEERIFVTAYDDVRRISEYTNHTGRIIELGLEIMRHLGPRYSLLLKYDILVGLCQGLYMENVYRLGFEDGVKCTGQGVSPPNKMHNRKF